MVSSCVSGSRVGKSLRSPQLSGRSACGCQLQLRYFALMAPALCLIAIFLAPEQPQQLASICEKHHSAVACRVF